MTTPTVYIVDDDPAVCRSTAMMLQAHGLESRSYPSADEFLRTFDPTGPGCLLLDLRMPGMTGEELLRTLLMEVIIKVDRPSAKAELTLRWRGGALTDLAIPFALHLSPTAH